MTIQNPYPGKRVEWLWEAHYTDGTVLKQEGHKIRDIEQDRLHSFCMTGEEREILIHWRPWYKLIHFYRTIIIHGNTEERRVFLYVFGYQDGNYKMMMVIPPDGNIIVTDDIDKVRFHT